MAAGVKSQTSLSLRRPLFLLCALFLATASLPMAAAGRPQSDDARGSLEAAAESAASTLERGTKDEAFIQMHSSGHLIKQRAAVKGDIPCAADMCPSGHQLKSEAGSVAEDASVTDKRAACCESAIHGVATDKAVFNNVVEQWAQPLTEIKRDVDKIHEQKFEGGDTLEDARLTALNMKDKTLEANFAAWKGKYQELKAKAVELRNKAKEMLAKFQTGAAQMTQENKDAVNEEIKRIKGIQEEYEKEKAKEPHQTEETREETQHGNSNEGTGEGTGEVTNPEQVRTNDSNPHRTARIGTQPKDPNVQHFDGRNGS